MNLTWFLFFPPLSPFDKLWFIHPHPGNVKEQYGALGCGSRTHYSLPWVLLWIPDIEEDLASHSTALLAARFPVVGKECLGLDCGCLWPARVRHAGEIVWGAITQLVCLHNTGTFALPGLIFRKFSRGMTLLFLTSLLAQTKTSAGQEESSRAL